jgi:hypothetical protein
MAGWSLDMPIIDHTPVHLLNKIALELLPKNFLCLQQQPNSNNNWFPQTSSGGNALENMQDALCSIRISYLRVLQQPITVRYVYMTRQQNTRFDASSTHAGRVHYPPFA